MSDLSSINYTTSAEIQQRYSTPNSHEECVARATAAADAYVEGLREVLEGGSTLEDLQLASNEAPVEEVLAREHLDRFKKEHDTLATLMQIRPPFSGARAHYTVTISAPDLTAAAAAGLHFKMYTQNVYHLAESLMLCDDKIDLACGFRLLMGAAGTYGSYDASYARLTVPEAERLDYDGVVSCDGRAETCDDPRVILRELMKVFGDEQIRDLVNERIEAIRSGTTVTIHEVNAAEPVKFVNLFPWWDLEESAEQKEALAAATSTGLSGARPWQPKPSA